jgi:hypothetical protein
MTTPDECTLSDMQKHVMQGGYDSDYNQLNSSNYTFVKTSKLGTVNSPGILIGTYGDKPDKLYELWGFLYQDKVVFIRNKSPPGEKFVLEDWSEAPIDQLPKFFIGKFVAFNLPSEQSRDRDRETTRQMEAMIKCLLLKSGHVSKVAGASFLYDLKNACKRMVRPTYRLKDFEVHGQNRVGDAYELVRRLIGHPLKYSVKEQKVTFSDGDIKKILCVRMGSDRFEKRGNEVWVASVQGAFHLFHKKVIRMNEDIVQVPTDMRKGPLGLDQLAVSIRHVKEPMIKRVLGEQRLAAFIDYIYLLSGKLEEIQGKANLLDRFEEACKEVLKDEIKRTKNADSKNKEVEDAVNSIRNDVSSDLINRSAYRTLY